MSGMGWDQMTDRTPDETALDARYRAWLKKNPGKSFSEYFDGFHVPKIMAGHPHASLGRNLTTGDWRVSGKGSFRRVCDAFSCVTGAKALPKDSVVCELGCGTLRIGAHFIDHLGPGRFAGLDISQALIDEGRTAFAELVRAKRPVLGTFDNTLEAAADLCPDLVFAFNVVCHVHPDEEETFYDRLLALAHKPGCVVVLQVVTHPEPIRYQESGWARPVEDYIDRMAPLIHHRHDRDLIKTGEKGGREIESRLLAFRRPAQDV
ncbi:hypothetical protein RAZWK3B_19856 [Roseobacter sp. AzwK-3b]|nr:hypothetical protein RAZWK3B_19856 [Roseobacter sp. AzwK-3b]